LPIVTLCSRRASSTAEGWKKRCAITVGDDRREDDGGDEERELGLVDDARLQAVERGDRAEGEPRRHQQGGEGAVRGAVAAGERVDAEELGHQLRSEEEREHAEFRPQRVDGDAHAALEEEEGRQEGEGDHAQAFLLLAMRGVVVCESEAEDEGR